MPADTGVAGADTDDGDDDSADDDDGDDDMLICSSIGICCICNNQRVMTRTAECTTLRAHTAGRYPAPRFYRH